MSANSCNKEDKMTDSKDHRKKGTGTIKTLIFFFFILSTAAKDSEQNYMKKIKPNS